jgi:hemerythrin-like domain-containing protein
MCSYCGCRNIPMIAKLTKEHEDIAACAYKLTAAYREGDVAAGRVAAQELAGKLNPHARREENGIFAELKKDDLFTDHVEELCAEHDDLDRYIDAIIAGDLSYTPGLVLLLKNHIDREENGLFPSALTYLSDDQWETIHSPTLMQD